MANHTAAALQKELRSHADPAIAEHSKRFFKTGDGEYGSGDQFLGLRVPTLRALAKKHWQISNTETLKILRSSYHEERLFALLLWVYRFPKVDVKGKESIYKCYLKNTRYINNWDLVDTSAHVIVGGWLMDKDRTPLVELAKSTSLWERRIAIITTYHFIKDSQFTDTLRISKLLLRDEEDLIHKAVGWMLREVGNRDRQVEEKFLLKHYPQMPRTMLRYAIEKFSKPERQAYLTGAR